VAELDETGLERRLLGRSIAETQVVEADFARAHIELRRKGVTLSSRPTKAVIDGRSVQMSTSGLSKPNPTRQV